MTIAVSNIIPTSYCLKPSKKALSEPEKKNQISFEGLFKKHKIQSSQFLEEDFADFIKKDNKVTFDEYYDVAKNHPSVILQAKEYSKKGYGGIITPKEMAKIVLKSDKYLKENFKNFRIISIGTSPSCLAKHLADLGHEVIFLPVSGLSEYVPENNLLEELPDLKILMDYLEKKKINDGKLNIILDYTATGRSLRYMTGVIADYFKLGLKNIKSLSLDDLLDCAFYKASLTDRISKKSFLDDVEYHCVSQLSNTPHFPVTNPAKEKYQDEEDALFFENISEEEFFKKFDTAINPVARAYSLSTLDEIDKLKQKELLENNPNLFLSAYGTDYTE